MPTNEKYLNKVHFLIALYLEYLKNKNGRGVKYIINGSTIKINNEKYILIKESKNCFKQFEQNDSKNNQNNYDTEEEKCTLIILSTGQYSYYDNKIEYIKQKNQPYHEIIISEKIKYIVITKEEMQYSRNLANLLNNENYGQQISIIKLFNYYYLDDDGLISNISSVYDRKFFIYSDFIKYVFDVMRYSFNLSCVLGTGVSLDYGAKNWNGLLNELKSELTTVCDIPNDVVSSIGGSNNSCAELVRLTSNSYYKIISESLYPRKFIIKHPTTLETLSKIIKTNNRIHNIITYNYDDYLETELRNININPNVIYKQHSLKFTQYNPNIYHVHGYMPNGKYALPEYKESIILSEKEYYDLYNNSNVWNVNQQVNEFYNNTCLFIGNSITDDYEKRLLDIANNDYKFHFIILCDRIRDSDNCYHTISNRDKMILSKYYLHYGILILWVSYYEEISNLLCDIFDLKDIQTKSYDDITNEKINNNKQIEDRISCINLNKSPTIIIEKIFDLYNDLYLYDRNNNLNENIQKIKLIKETLKYIDDGKLPNDIINLNTNVLIKTVIEIIHIVKDELY